LYAGTGIAIQTWFFIALTVWGLLSAILLGLAIPTIAYKQRKVRRYRKQLRHTRAQIEKIALSAVNAKTLDDIKAMQLALRRIVERNEPRRNR
jgi:hypothetical protein